MATTCEAFTKIRFEYTFCNKNTAPIVFFLDTWNRLFFGISAKGLTMYNKHFSYVLTNVITMQNVLAFVHSKLKHSLTLPATLKVDEHLCIAFLVQLANISIFWNNESNQKSGLKCQYSIISQPILESNK